MRITKIIVKIIFRIIAFPFWIILLFTAAQKLWLWQTILYIRFGGEGITYWKKDQSKMIKDVYMKVEQLIDKTK